MDAIKGQQNCFKITLKPHIIINDSIIRKKYLLTLLVAHILSPVLSRYPSRHLLSTCILESLLSHQPATFLVVIPASPIAHSFLASLLSHLVSGSTPSICPLNMGFSRELTFTFILQGTNTYILPHLLSSLCILFLLST